MTITLLTILLHAVLMTVVLVYAVKETDDFERENEEARGRITLIGVLFVCMIGVVMGGLIALLVHTIHPW